MKLSRLLFCSWQCLILFQQSSICGFFFLVHKIIIQFSQFSKIDYAMMIHYLVKYLNFLSYWQNYSKFFSYEILFNLQSRHIFKNSYHSSIYFFFIQTSSHTFTIIYIIVLKDMYVEREKKKLISQNLRSNKYYK